MRIGTAGDAARYLLQASLSWSEELARYLLMWLAMLSAAYGFKIKAHFALVFVVNRFPGGVRRAISLAVSILVCALLLLFVLKAVEITWSVRRQTGPATGLSKAFPYASGIAGGTLMCYYVARNAWRDWRAGVRPAETSRAGRGGTRFRSGDLEPGAPQYSIVHARSLQGLAALHRDPLAPGSAGSWWRKPALTEVRRRPERRRALRSMVRGTAGPVVSGQAASRSGSFPSRARTWSRPMPQQPPITCTPLSTQRWAVDTHSSSECGFSTLGSAKAWT